MNLSYLIVLLCSCAWRALIGSPNKSFLNSLGSSREKILNSNLSGRVTGTFYAIHLSAYFVTSSPRSLMLLTLKEIWSAYLLIVSSSCIFRDSNSLSSSTPAFDVFYCYLDILFQFVPSLFCCFTINGSIENGICLKILHKRLDFGFLCLLYTVELVLSHGRVYR